MADLRLNYNTAMFYVCMDTKTSGRLVSRRLTAPIAFNDLPSLLLKADLVMDAQDHPRAFQRKRQFDESQSRAASVPYAQSENEMMSEEEVEAAAGALTTLRLQVVTRQNASWQGAVTTPDKQRHSFDSVLQLLELIDNLTGT